MDTRKVMKLYLEANDLTIAFAARKIGISVPALFRWLNYELELKPDTLVKVKHFMDGDFLKSVNQIMESDINDGE